MTKDVVLSARIPEEMKEGLADLAAATDRPIAWHVAQALANYVEMNRWQVAAIKEGLAQVDAGEIVPLEDVERWVASWGMPRELPRPEPRKHASKRRK
jgi:predicted transcriptional regulator